MERRDKDKPFFLQLSYSDPHTPYDAPKVHDPRSLTLPPFYPDTQLVREYLAAYYDEITPDGLRFRRGTALPRRTTA